VTRYRLPEALGEVEMLTDQEPTRAVNEYRWVHHAELGLIQVHRNRLTEVKPPLPEDPGPGAWLVNGQVCVRTTEDDDAAPWCWPGALAHGTSTWSEWPDLLKAVGVGPIVRLVPDPLAEAPELPWETTDADGVDVRIGRTVPAGRFAATVMVADYIGGLTRDEACAAGLALLRASAEQEAKALPVEPDQ
jgi:hypothetical protein